MSNIDKETLEKIQKIAWDAVGAKAHSTADKALIAIHSHCTSRINKDTSPAANPVLDLDNPPSNLRSGNCPVRVLGKVESVTNFCYVVAVADLDGQEQIFCASKVGVIAARSRPDLTAGPIAKEGWVNIYSDPSNNRVAKTGATVYQDEPEAREVACIGGSIATIKITWEE
jgi:hypothetical protein